MKNQDDSITCELGLIPMVMPLRLAIEVLDWNSGWCILKNLGLGNAASVGFPPFLSLSLKKRSDCTIITDTRYAQPD